MKTRLVLALTCVLVVAVPCAVKAHVQWPRVGAAAPEPSSLALLGVGLLGFAGLMRNRIK